MNCSKSVSVAGSALTRPVWRSTDKMIMNKLECCILSCCFLTVFITGGGAVLAHYRHFAIGRYSLATMNHLTAVAWTVVPSLLAT